MKKLITKGYKVTDKNLQCKSYQYEIGKKFKITGAISICNHGFHFCELLNSCFEYYSFDPTNRVFEVVSYGKVITENDKSCTAEIEFIRELTWLEVLVLVNTGKDNTGRSNSGNRNSGDWNSGNRNSGDWNSGNRNSGNRNSGDCNSGYRNSGDWNSGNCNSGDWNSGNRNSGDCNSGDWNSGNRNSGDCNSGYRNSGAFCTEQNPRLVLFDVQTDILIKDWEQSEACRIMNNLNPNIWVDSSYMTPEEKEKFPTHETTGGYLKTIPYKEVWANLWHNLTEDKKNVFLTLQHFNKDKFKEITGISV